MATYEFEKPDIQFHGRKLAPGGSCVLWIDDGGERQKWRCTFTVNDDGTWQWAPGPPAGVAVPQDVTDDISARVALLVAEFGVDRREFGK